MKFDDLLAGKKPERNKHAQAVPEKIDEAHSLKLDVQDDHEVSMAQADLYKMARYARDLHNMLDNFDELEGWVQAKITLASDYISTVKHYLEYELEDRKSREDAAAYDQGSDLEPAVLDEDDYLNDLDLDDADEDSDYDNLDPDKDKVQHIVMQLRKAKDVDGNFPIKFANGTSYKLTMDMINKFLDKHDAAKPAGKDRMTQMGIKSLEGFKSQL